jgi:hypothetical protein
LLARYWHHAWFDAGRKPGGWQIYCAWRKIALIIRPKPDKVTEYTRELAFLCGRTRYPDRITPCISDKVIMGIRKMHSHDNKTALFNII